MDGLNARTVDLAHVGRVDQHERDERPEEGLLWDSIQLQRRDAKAEHIDDQDAGHAAEEVHEDRGEDPKRRKRGRGDGARKRDQQSDRKDEQLRNDEEAHIDGERLSDRRERSGEVASVKEGLLDLWPGGG